jgi:hypothetical protein
LQIILPGFGETDMSTIQSRLFWSAVALLLLFMFPVRASSQCPLTLQVSNTPVQQLSIGDIDFEHFQSRTLLFTMAIGNSSALPANAVIDITMDVQLTDGSVFAPALTYKSLPFPVKAGGQTFTNLDMGSSSIVIKTASFDYDDQAKKRLDDVVLGTGRFPSGKYSFLVKVTCEDGTGEQNGHFVLVLRNASRVELRSPIDGESTNQFPLFEFFTDATSARLVVAEIAPGGSPQDAINRDPAMLDVDLHNQNSYFYSGGRLLEQGKSYAWQVTGKSLGSGGLNDDIKSEIRKFTVTQTGLTEDEILRRIEEILGPKHKGVFDKIRKGEFKLTGKYTNNNATISTGELLNLIYELRDALDNAEVGLE